MAGKRGGKGSRRKQNARQKKEHGNLRGNDGRGQVNEKDQPPHRRAEEREQRAISPGHATDDPPGSHDIDPNSRTRIRQHRDLSDAVQRQASTNHWKHEHAQRGDTEIIRGGKTELSSQYSYSSEESDQNDYYSRNGNDPRYRGEDEAGRMQQQQHQHQQHQQQHQQQSQQYNQDHAFTQFNIRPLQIEEANNSEYSDSESEDEEAPLFFEASNNFNFATDSSTKRHIKGVSWGMDYLQTRAQRKEQQRKKQQRNDADWDDVDFDDYHRSFNCRRAAKCIVACTLVLVVAIAFVHRDKLKDTSAADANIEGSLQSAHVYKPSSRWGHRFDDDDTALDGDDNIDVVDVGSRTETPKYHHHSHKNHSKLSPEEQEMAWEDYETEVANVLADSGPGWDIHSKTGGHNAKNDYDGFSSHWVRYFDKASQNYYYFHRETNATQWEKPLMNEGVVLLGVAYGTGRDYVIEAGAAAESGNITQPAPEEGSEVDRIDVGSNTSSFSSAETNSLEIPAGTSDTGTSQFARAQEVLDWYKDSFWRWNHPYRKPESAEAWSGIDTAVFWRIPMTGATTVEEIFTHCFHMIVAGTTGASKDGKDVLSHNVSDSLSVLTLDDGAHYINVDTNTAEGIQKAKHAGLGRSGVADVIITRFVYNSAELFRGTGFTGRCFTMLRHPIHRAVAVFHSLQRNNVKAVSGMSLLQYAQSPVAEDNWMVRILTNTMVGDLTQQHLEVAQGVFGRKCLVGLVDRFPESMERFAKFFHWEDVKSVNKHHALGSLPSDEKDLETKRKCFANKVRTGTNRHQYAKITESSEAWNHLYAKNQFDMELYKYAEALYLKQNVVYKVQRG